MVIFAIGPISTINPIVIIAPIIAKYLLANFIALNASSSCPNALNSDTTLATAGWAPKLVIANINTK